MAKSNFPPISECAKSIKSGKLKPVYFLSGEDTYSIDKVSGAIIKAATPFIFSDFDKVMYRGGEENNLADILALASSFPFGSEKKLVIIKDFEKFRDKKSLVNYLNSPPDFTILLIVQYGAVATPATEPYKSLSSNEFIFEAKELKGKHLIQWVINYAEENGRNISSEDAQMIVETVGDNRALIQDQIEKIITFTSGKNDITRKDISFLAAEMKEYTVFDLLDAIGRKDKEMSFKYAYNLLEKGKEPVLIIFMLTRFFSVLSRMTEIQLQNIPHTEAAKMLGVFSWNYRDYVNARKLYSEKQLVSAAEALLKADTSVKTTTADNKTIISLLLAEILAS